MAASCIVCKSADLSNFDPDLLDTYTFPICVDCKSDEYTSLITKSEAKSTYLLTDEELNDKQAMPWVTRKNPKQPRWSPMRLYLGWHVEQFAIRKFGSLDAVLRMHDLNEAQRAERKQKKFTKKLKALRQQVKPKIVKAATGSNHVHDFYQEPGKDTPIVTKRCRGCSATIREEVL